MGHCVFLLDVVSIVGGHQLDLMLFGHADQQRIEAFLYFEAMATNFDVEVFGKFGFPPEQRFFGLTLPYIE